MANILQLINKSQILEEKAKRLTEETLLEIKRKNIGSTPEIIYRIYLVMKDFYESIGKPNMKIRKANGAPSSSDYNTMMKEIKNDLVAMHDEYESLEKTLSEVYTQMQTDQRLITNAITNAFKSAEKAQFKIDNINCNAVFLEGFTTKNYFDSDACNMSPCFLNTSYQYISLATSDYKSVNENATIHILDGSNGFSGNTHQVKLVDNEIKFYGADNPRLNLADILDEDTDTWFEYEAYKISDETRIETLGLGFNYDEGISWTIEDSKLLLTLAIRFDTAKLVNTFSLSPYLASDKGALCPIIEEITLSDGKGTLRNVISSSENFDGSKTYSFPKQYCKELIITLSQDTPYETTIGHTYYKEIPHDNINYYKVNESSHNRRVEGAMPSVSNVGIIYDSNTKKFLQPSASYGDSITNETYIKEELFDLNDTETLKKAYHETLSAERFLIGLRDMSLCSYAYESQSEYVSKNYETTKPITVVSIQADEFIPEFFESDTDWITYYFSLNDGVDWHPIIPKGLYKQLGYNKYLVNSSTPAEFRDSNIGYIETEEDNYNIRVKIEMNRPTGVTDIEYYTPIVYKYILEL